MKFEIPEMEVIIFTTEDVMDGSGLWGSESEEEQTLYKMQFSWLLIVNSLQTSNPGGLFCPGNFISSTN